MAHVAAKPKNRDQQLQISMVLTLTPDQLAGKW